MSLDPKDMPKLMKARYDLLTVEQAKIGKELKAVRAYLVGAGIIPKQTRGPGSKKNINAPTQPIRK